MSTATEKLAEFARAWADADKNYTADVNAAGGDTKLLAAIDDNWWTHQANWARAATAALEKTSSEIEKLYADAKQANDDIEAARKKAEKIAKIVKKSAAVANGLKDLLKVVS